MSSRMVTFRARMHLTSEKEGGRKTPVESGLRVDILFEGKSRIAAIELDDSIKFLFPGQFCDVRFRILLHEEIEIIEIQSAKEVLITNEPHKIGNLTSIISTTQQGENG